VKVVVAQADSMQPDIGDGGKGLVLIDDSGPLLIWGVGLLLLSFSTPEDATGQLNMIKLICAPWRVP
jgi:hypothetical protein